MKDDWEDVENVHIPREWLDFDREAVNAFCWSTDRFVKCGCLLFWVFSFDVACSCVIIPMDVKEPSECESMEEETTIQEQLTALMCTQIQVRYEKLTEQERMVLKNIMKKSPAYKDSPLSRMKRR